MTSLVGYDHVVTG